MTLPINIDTTYADNAGDASVKLHQEHHDTIHAFVNGSNPAEIAYAENVTGTSQTGIGGTITDITSCSISVAASTRPVYLAGMITLTATATGGTASYAGFWLTEVSNGVDTAIQVAVCAPVPGVGIVTTAVISPFRLASSTARTRTFKLQASTSDGSTTITVYNSAAFRSVIWAEGR